MSEAERDRMQTRLDAFSQRLDARTREFETHGEFSDVHVSLLRQIEARREQVQGRLASAEANGRAWDLIKIEFERDFASIFDDWQQLDDELESGAMKHVRK
jgi:hypothetical protein